MLILYFQKTTFSVIMSWLGRVGNSAGQVGSDRRKWTRGHHWIVIKLLGLCITVYGKMAGWVL